MRARFLVSRLLSLAFLSYLASCLSSRLSPLARFPLSPIASCLCLLHLPPYRLLPLSSHPHLVPRTSLRLASCLWPLLLEKNLPTFELPIPLLVSCAPTSCTLGDAWNRRCTSAPTRGEPMPAPISQFWYYSSLGEISCSTSYFQSTSHYLPVPVHQNHLYIARSSGEWFQRA